MMNRQHSWSFLLRTEGPECLKWMLSHNALESKFKILAEALWELLPLWVQTPEVAREVWVAAPAVLASCDEKETFDMPGAALAYSWLHLLDRYVRTWRALEILLETNCIPMGRYGVRVLDVGTGPGPSSFAIHDFYSSMTEFARTMDKARWEQLAEIECVELDCRTNNLRHNLAKIVSAMSPSQPQSVLAMCSAFPDFGRIRPAKERKEEFERLRWSEYSYYDDERGTEGSELMYSASEANRIAQSLRRYRLLAFSNFLTTVDTVREFEQNLRDTFYDADAGTVILIVGGKGPQYPDVYKSLEELAVPAGFRPVVQGQRVSAGASSLVNFVHAERKRFYGHLLQLAPSTAWAETHMKPVYER